MKRNYDSLTRLLQQTRQVAEMAKRCTPSHPFLFFTTVPLCFILLTVMNNHSIHAQQDGLVDWPHKVLLQVLSPTPLLKSAVHRLLLFTYHQRDQVSAQFSIPVRTSHLRPCLRKWMRDKASEGLSLSLRMQQREASAATARIHHTTGESSTTSSAHIQSAVRLVAIHSHIRKSSRDTRREQETNSSCDRIRTERQEVRDHRRFREDEAAEREDAASSRLSGAEHHTRLLFEHRNLILYEARSEKDMQEVRSENADKWSPANHTDKFILIALNPTIRIRKTKTHGEHRLGSKQNWKTVKDLNKKLVLELSRKWKN